MIKKRSPSVLDNHLEIYEKKKSKPSMTNPELADWAQVQFKLEKKPNPSTISKILKRGAERLA